MDKVEHNQSEEDHQSVKNDKELFILDDGSAPTVE